MKRMTFALVLILGLVLSACGPEPTPAPTQDVSAVQTQAVADAYATQTATAPTPIAPPPGPTPDPGLPVAVVPAGGVRSACGYRQLQHPHYERPWHELCALQRSAGRRHRPGDRCQPGRTMVGDQRPARA